MISLGLEVGGWLIILAPSMEGCSSHVLSLHLHSLPGIPPELQSVVVAGLRELPDNTFRLMVGSSFSD